jgi:hypothetical protein
VLTEMDRVVDIICFDISFVVFEPCQSIPSLFPLVPSFFSYGSFVFSYDESKLEYSMNVIRE